MKDKINYTELVYDYLDNMLDENQLKDFNNEIKNNTELKKELKLQQDILNVFKDKEKLAFYKSMIESEKRAKTLIARICKPFNIAFCDL